MAYSNNIEIHRTEGNGKCITVVITELEVSSTDEAGPIDLGMDRFRVLRQSTVKVSGSATTLNPILGRATNPTGKTVLVENETPGDPIDNSPSPPVSCWAPAKNLYHRSKPNIGSDNVIYTEYHIIKDWI